jgi:CO dehydrogenase/acetyl-CoA synthase beta subunit
MSLIVTKSNFNKNLIKTNLDYAQECYLFHQNKMQEYQDEIDRLNIILKKKCEHVYEIDRSDIFHTHYTCILCSKFIL